MTRTTRVPSLPFRRFFRFQEVADFDSGAPEDRPAYLVHGNIHAGEVAGTHAALCTVRVNTRGGDAGRCLCRCRGRFRLPGACACGQLGRNFDPRYE